MIADQALRRDYPPADRTTITAGVPHITFAPLSRTAHSVPTAQQQHRRSSGRPLPVV
ncbi:hypothetical protein ACWD00_32695 [Streptomyces viridiviolaceus]